MSQKRSKKRTKLVSELNEKKNCKIFLYIIKKKKVSLVSLSFSWVFLDKIKAAVE